MNNLEKQIYELSLPITESCNMELVEVNEVYEHGMHIIRVIIDCETGVDIDITTKINQQISDKLDEVDPIEGEYYLEVTSAGLERELKTTESIIKSIGKYVNVKTYEKIAIGNNSYKEFEGQLESADNEKIILLARIKQFDKTVCIPLSKIAKIRLAIHF